MSDAGGFLLKDSHNRTGRTYATLEDARRAVRSTVPIGARWEIRRILKGGETSALVTSGRKAG